MLTVTIYRGNQADIHTSKVYSGLSSLATQGRIKLRFSWRLPPLLSNPEVLDRFTVWLRAEQHGSQRHICFDLRDSGEIAWPEALEKADVYYKRSFRVPAVAILRKSLRGKVKPFGLNFECVNHRPTGEFRLRLSHLISRKSGQGMDYNKIYHLLKHRFVPVNGASVSKEDFAYPTLATGDLSSEPTGISDGAILFLTRTWSPDQIRLPPEQLEKINTFRADIIRALRESFGTRAITGFADCSYARDHYPDCIAEHSTDKESYAGLLEACTIAVQTAGLRDSTGWKIGEYLAAGKCIVSEPISDLLPEPLEENTHLLTFSTPEECVAACQRLLDDQVLASQMQKNNRDYYLAEVEPAAQVYRCIIEAFD
jgi:hypothetical protein